MTTSLHELRWVEVPVDTTVVMRGDDVLGRVRRDLYGTWAEQAEGEGDAASAWRVVPVGLRRDRFVLRGERGDHATLVMDWSGHARMLFASGATWTVERRGDGTVRVHDAALGTQLHLDPARQVFRAAHVRGEHLAAALLLLAWRPWSQGARAATTSEVRLSRRELLRG